MNYSTLTDDLSALCRDAMLSDEPLNLQEVPNHGTAFEVEQVSADEEYALWLVTYLYE
jgi:hypothetical protein